MSAPVTDPPELVRTQRIQLDVSGMSCGSCARRIQTKLNKAPGVRASVNFATRVATVDTDELTAEQLCDIVEKAGFSAVPRQGAVPVIEDPDADLMHDLLMRLLGGIFFFIPLAVLSVMFEAAPDTMFTGWQYVLTALAAPIVTLAAWPFHQVALRNARRGAASMETLISLGVVAATVWSLYATFVRSEPHHAHSPWQAMLGTGAVYWEVAAGVTVLALTGRYFEARAKSKAGDALRALAARGAKNVCVLLPNGDEQVVPAAELQTEQRFVVRPGETIAADGIVVDGTAAVDTSAMTGEAKPVRVRPRTAVVGGTTVLDGRLVVEATAVGADTQFAAMVRLVEEAQTEKAAAQRLADRIAGVFVPAVLLLSLITGVGWIIADASAEHAFSAALAVLVIACPCTLGLATPTAMMVASGRGAQLGIFIKGYQALETTQRITAVVFDKTGTLTTGQLNVTAVTPAGGRRPGDVLSIAAAVEAASEHAIGAAIAAAAEHPSVDDFAAVPGCGVTGVVGGHHVEVGKPSWIERHCAADGAVHAARVAGESRSDTVVFVSVDKEVWGAIAVADTVKESAADAVAALKSRGLQTVLLSGDNRGAAGAVAGTVGIDTVFAEVLPEGKVEVIRQLRESGHAVAMVGDGVNDGPALARADLGLAIGRGTDVALGAADIILVRDNLETVPQALDLSRATMRTIRMNLVWAFGYNVAAIPIAAAGLLNPLVADAAMAFSSFFVVSNSLRLRRFTPKSPS